MLKWIFSLLGLMNGDGHPGLLDEGESDEPITIKGG